MTTQRFPLPPGATIGMLGGGQLGRMATLAAARLGYTMHIYTAQEDSPAVDVAAHHTRAAWDDEAALEAFVQAVDVVTLEFENIPVQTVQWLSERLPVHPRVEALAIAQDRAKEKLFLTQAGAKTAPYLVVEDVAQVEQGLGLLGPRCILKRARFGYDGKGQVALRPGDDCAAAWAKMGGERGVLEGFVQFEREVSVVLARGLDGQIVAYPVVENQHKDHILHRTIVPASISPAVEQAAQALAAKIAHALDYVGVLAIEMFVTEDGEVLANEIAPRPHNSGHWTMDAAITDQFEQQIRAVCGLPLGSAAMRCPVVMENLLGEDVLRWPELLAMPNAKLHLYGKDEARAGRKMGHVNFLMG